MTADGYPVRVAVGPDRIPVFLDVPVGLFIANALLLNDQIRVEGLVKTALRNNVWKGDVMSITADGRAAFEAAWSNVYDTGDFLLRHHTLTEQYANHDTQRAWEGWMLALAASPAATVIPDEPLSPIAEVCEDTDGTKHIESVIEDLDDIPAGTKLYAATHRFPKKLDEYHEDEGPVMWWTWQGDSWLYEPSWCGTPSDSDWPGYHTHWTPHPELPPTPRANQGSR
jgi:hypothetical protein